jgi:hypothetical protein
MLCIITTFDEQWSGLAGDVPAVALVVQVESILGT